MKLFSHLIFIVTCIVFAPTASAEENTKPTVQLPKVLLIGDSICGGYQKEVKRLLEGKADVIKSPGNAQYTGTGVQKIDEWLGEEKWGIIHFNWGLWDMYGWEFAKQDRSPDTYAKRLDQIVVRLKKTGAKLIWATTTPACPDAEVTMLKRFKTELIITPEIERQYIAAAARVMKKHGVQVNDLYNYIRPDLKKYSPSPDNVHFTGSGNGRLAKKVASTLEAALAELNSSK